MRHLHRQAWLDHDHDEADFDIRKHEAPSATGDLLGSSPALVSFVILGVTLVVDAILIFVSVLFAATIFLIFVSFILWFVSAGITILLCGVGAVISLIGMLCTLRRPPALVANTVAFLTNAGMVGLACWFLAEFPNKFR